MADDTSKGKTVNLFTKSNLTATEVASLTTPVTDSKVTDSKAPLDNLIDMAKKSNELLTSDTSKLKTNSNKVMQILKNNGMDSQQAERAHKQLMEL